MIQKKSDMKEKTDAVLADFLCCDIEDLEPNKCIFTDLYADSLALVGVVSCLSETFDIEFTDDDIGKISTVNSIHHLVFEKALFPFL